MEEEKIEAWYDKEKEKLRLLLANGVSKPEARETAEEQYRLQMKELREQYEKKIEKVCQKQIDRIKA